MSRFLDKLNQASQAAPAMGFKAKPAASPKAGLLLIAGLDQSSLKSAADYVVGADAGLLRISKTGTGAEAIRQVIQSVADIPWGAWFKDVGQEAITLLVNAGGDFIVFPLTSSAPPILEENKTGKILEIDTSLGGDLLTAVNKLPVDAILISGEQGADFFTWQYLMQVQHCADALTKPLLASIPPDAAANELQALWVAGVDAVVVEAAAGQPGRLMELRQLIDRLNLPSQRKRGKLATVPYISGQIRTETEEPEEE